MKLICMTLIFVFAIFIANAQNVKSYIAIIKTKDNKFKGLFVKIDSQKAILYLKDKYQEVNTSAIKSIKLRVTKASYELQSYIFKYVKKEDPKVYKYTNQRGESVD